jgi:hypothetical protein
MPFTYLGLPLGTTKPNIEDFLPLVSKCEKKLVSTSIFLSQAGRLQLTNSVYTSLPTFCLCTFKVHKTILKAIDKFRKHCLWRGADINAKTPPKAAWEMICLPKDQGGLGVLQLESQNEALLRKNLHKFFNKENIPWVQLIWEKYYRNGKLLNHTMKGSFWSRYILKLLGKHKGLASMSVKRGDCCFLWQDNWMNLVPMTTFHELFSFSVGKNITVQKARSTTDRNVLFQLPLSQEAHQQLLHFATLLDNLGEETDEHDI